jgi:hypothetical protein
LPRWWGGDNSFTCFRRKSDINYGKWDTNLTAAFLAPTNSGTLRLDVFGASLKLYFDGVLVASATDASFTAPGGVGLLDIGGGSSFTAFSTYQVLPVTAPFTDNFTGPADDTLGDPWSVDQGGFSVNGSGQAAAGASALNVATLIGVLTSSASAATTMNGFGGGLALNWNGTTQSGYVLLLTSQTNLSLFTVTNGVLGAAVESWTVSGNAVANTLALEVSGTDLTATLNGISLSPTFTNLTVFVSGSVGIASTGGTVFDSFTAN